MPDLVLQIILCIRAITVYDNYGERLPVKEAKRD